MCAMERTMHNGRSLVCKFSLENLFWSTDNFGILLGTKHSGGSFHHNFRRTWNSLPGSSNIYAATPSAVALCQELTLTLYLDCWIINNSYVLSFPSIQKLNCRNCSNVTNRHYSGGKTNPIFSASIAQLFLPWHFSWIVSCPTVQVSTTLQFQLTKTSTVGVTKR